MEKPTIVSVLGWSGSGKTTFIEAAMRECARRGLAVGALKKSKHSPDSSAEEKDSVRFFTAGAISSTYLSPTAMVRISQPPARVDRDTVAELCPGAALIFCEGLEIDGAVVALVDGPVSAALAPKRPLSEIDVFIAAENSLSRAGGYPGLSIFSPEQTIGFVDYVLGRSSKRESEAPQGKKEIHIYADGKEIPLVPYVSGLFFDTLSAMTATLKGAENASTVTISIVSRSLLKT
jgi:molybdopterin-guanine dinucleotide biosynthesis protein